jgi:hypothetical protein
MQERQDAEKADNAVWSTVKVAATAGLLAVFLSSLHI